MGYINTKLFPSSVSACVIFYSFSSSGWFWVFVFIFFSGSGVSTLVMLHHIPTDIICCWKFICWELCMFSRSHIVHYLDVDVS